jgi:hypothetical protein
MSIIDSLVTTLFLQLITVVLLMNIPKDLALVQ